MTQTVIDLRGKGLIELGYMEESKGKFRISEKGKILMMNVLFYNALNQDQKIILNTYIPDEVLRIIPVGDDELS